MDVYIKGKYRKSIFESGQGFFIGLFKVKESNNEDYVNRTITFTGYFDELNSDNTYIFYGKEVNHPRYGTQFEVEKYEKVKPTDKEGIVVFLSSDLFKGIGENLAKSIVNTLGDKALEEIMKDKSCLNLVPKMTSKKIDTIYNTLEKYEESHKIIVSLNNLGFNTKDALSIYNKHRSMSLDVIENNIYRLLEIKDITFDKVDSLALKNGIEKTDSRRIKALIIYVMEMISYQNGDLFLSKEVISNGVNKLLKEDLNYDEEFKQLEEEYKIKKDNDDYYLKDIWDAQNRVIDRIHVLLNKEVKAINLDKIILSLESENDIKYNDRQKQAIERALSNNISIITGGPGTGKTTIVKAIVDIYKKINKLNDVQMNNALALLAPTGRASKKMSESTGFQASTIHRFLKWNKETNEFMVNEYNKDNSNLIIIDEVSMIDINLFDSLLKGLTTNIKLVLVGDYNQLPSVGPGQILKDLIDSDIIDTVYLDRLYRQDENSYIPVLAREIKEGEISESFLEKKSDFLFLQSSSINLKTNLQKICKQIIDKGYGYKDMQVLAPMYKGENGIDLLNRYMQDIFNPSSNEKREIKYGDVVFRENDKILQLTNMPDDNVYNGDIGVIRYIKYASSSKSGKNEIYVDYDGNLVKYTPRTFINIKHGYIISIHKSQGSEFDIVVMPIVNAYYRMLYRKLIYTGVTRAKKKLILIGEVNAFATSVRNNNECLRNSSFKDKLLYRFSK